ncbi:conserved hypothetical protein [Burkholderia multivorans CGD1]|nr:conserved hypothetical protein [Burkholderia multivorans CGD1]
MPSCSGANNALRWTAGAGFTCAGSIALTSSGLNQFAATTSAQLAGVVTDETGSGSLVFANGPVINNLSATGSLTGFVGRLLNVQVFTANGTYTPTSGTAKVIVTVQAPGGGSGAVPATAAGQSAAASGGGAGSYAKALITSGFSGVTITAPGGALPARRAQITAAPAQPRRSVRSYRARAAIRDRRVSRAAVPDSRRPPHRRPHAP